MTTTITFIAHPKVTSDNREGFEYSERRVDFVNEYGETVSANMCDPDAGWSEPSQWIAQKHLDYLFGLGLTFRQVIDVMDLYAWDATSGVRKEFEVDTYGRIRSKVSGK